MFCCKVDRQYYPRFRIRDSENYMANIVDIYSRIAHIQVTIECEKMSISSLTVLELLSDQRSVMILDAIAKDVTNSWNLIKLLNLTRKQYYDRSTRLLNIGLIRRKDGEFYLTSFGQIVRHSHLKITLALKHSSQLRAIDVLRSDPGLPKDRLNSLIDDLIGDPELKRLFTLT